MKLFQLSCVFIFLSLAAISACAPIPEEDAQRKRLGLSENDFHANPDPEQASKSETVASELAARTSDRRLDLNFLFQFIRPSLSVSRAALQRGILSVPEQAESWSCGINSGARFAAMLNHPVPDYGEFLKDAPHYGGFLWIPDIGKNPEGIRDYLRMQPTNLRSFAIEQRCTTIFHPQFEVINHSLTLGRPVLVLLMTTGTSMHWVNLVAKNPATHNWIYLETDGRIMEMTGGDDELKHRMNLDNCAAQKLWFVERFNSISATQCAWTYVGVLEPGSTPCH